MNYLDFLSKVNVESLLERNEVYDDPGIHETVQYTVCRLCSQPVRGRRVVRMNNGCRVCEDCFQELLTTRYPERYQKLHEEWLAQRAARNLALDEYVSAHPALKGARRSAGTARAAAIMLVALVACGGLLLILNWLHEMGVLLPLVLCTIGAAVCTLVASRHAMLLRAKLAADKATWLQANAEPPRPDLREFYDPTAELTARDQRVLEVLDYWPGRPPYWEYVRNDVLRRDGNRCQVSGCPSRTQLHVHHKTPRSKGGSHRADNLVTLCLFHHGLCPGEGHGLVWRDVVTEHFSVVRAHYREGSLVKAHVRCRTLATEAELARIVDDYALTCRMCHSAPTARVDETGNKVSLHCLCVKPVCVIDQGLLEETGPRVAGHYDVGRHKGSWDITPYLFNCKTPDVIPHQVGGESVSVFPEDDVRVIPDSRRRRRPTAPRTLETRRRQ